MESKLNPCLIPARYGSTRFPGKPLALISGKPMIVRVAEIASKVFGIDGTYVVTDSNAIVDVLDAHGLRSIKIAEECATGTDRIARAAELFPNSERIFNVQGDEPVLDVDDLRAFKIFSEEQSVAVTNAYCSTQSPSRANSQNAIKMVLSDSEQLLYASRSPIPFRQNATQKSTWDLQVCMYSFTAESLKWFSTRPRGKVEEAENIEILRFVEGGVPIQMFEVFGESHPVDVPEDVPIVEDILSKRF